MAFHGQTTLLQKTSRKYGGIGVVVVLVVVFKTKALRMAKTKRKRQRTLPPKDGKIDDKICESSDCGPFPFHALHGAESRSLTG